MVESRLDLPACLVLCLLLDLMEFDGQTKRLRQPGEPLQIVWFQRDERGKIDHGVILQAWPAFLPAVQGD